MGVWYYSKGLKIYDEDFEDQTGNKKSQQPFLESNKVLLNKEENVLPLIATPKNKNQIEHWTLDCFISGLKNFV